MSRVIAFSILLGLLAGSVAAVAPELIPLGRTNVWSIGFCRVELPLELDDCVANLEPSIISTDVTDVSADFVADPFLARDSTGFFVFFELLNSDTQQGDIGVASSPDGREWQYRGLALDEPYHLSYPHVFADGGNWYMTPESEAADRISLYRATDFPMQWERVETLIEDVDLADPTVFKHDGRWWMFVGRAGKHDMLRLFQASTLGGPWEEHPRSPIVVANASIARPAGRVVAYDNQLFRVAQNSSGRYGREVVAFEITKLTTREYEERALPTPALVGGAAEWNAAGMHHLDALRVDDGWVVAVDGHRKELTLRKPALPW